MNEKPGRKHCRRYAQLKATRSNFESNWQESLDYGMPRKADITRFQVPGLKRGQTLFDTTAEDCVDKLSGALHSMLTNPVAPFFALTSGDDALDAEDDVREWLEDSAKRMHNVLVNSNFQTEVHETYVDLITIGTACLYMEEDKQNVIRFSARFMGEIYVSENAYGFIDTVYRHYKPKFSQAAEEFPDVPEFQKMAMERPDDRTEILHCVFPRKSTVYGKSDSTNMPWASEYVWVEKEKIISVGGYNIFPYAVPRWTKATGEDYGRSPLMKALPEVKMLNTMRETYIEALQLAARPPWIADDDGVLLPLDMTPDGMNYRRAGSDAKVEALQSRSDLVATAEAVKESRLIIRQCFYIDQLNLWQGGPQMTAAEVLQRTEESMRLIGPVLGRQHKEFLRPLVDRTFDIMWRRKMFLPPPTALSGKVIGVHYTSIIAKAQKVQEGQNLMRAMQMAAPIFQADPRTMQNVNGDEFVRFCFALYSSPAKVLNDRRVVASQRQQMEQAQKQAAAQDALNKGSETVKNLAPAMAMGGGNQSGEGRAAG